MYSISDMYRECVYIKLYFEYFLCLPPFYKLTARDGASEESPFEWRYNTTINGREKKKRNIVH